MSFFSTTTFKIRKAYSKSSFNFIEIYIFLNKTFKISASAEILPKFFGFGKFLKNRNFGFRLRQILKNWKFRFSASADFEKLKISAFGFGRFWKIEKPKTEISNFSKSAEAESRNFYFSKICRSRKISAKFRQTPKS